MNPIRNLSTVILIAVAAVIVSCGGGNDTYYPKPRGFYRLDLPEKIYVTYDSVYPFTCRLPESAFIASGSTLFFPTITDQ